MPAAPASPPEYESAVEDLDAFGRALVGLIKELLRGSGVHVHSVDFRVKKKDSALRKVAGSGERYGDASQLTDLLGVRVISYFADEVDRIADVLVPQFRIDEDNSVDKRAALDPDRFGYLSLHYVGRLTQERLHLAEYRRFGERCFELQIRSILQHAWAEIEHDLGYKPDGAVPRDARRRFSRLAGLLELADDEFVRLRSELGEYERAVGEKFEVEPAELEVDQSTVSAFLRSGGGDRLGRPIAELFGAPFAATVDSSYAAHLAKDLVTLGVESIGDLQWLVSAWEPQVVRFAEHWIGMPPGDAPAKKRRTRVISRGIGLFYLVYALVGNADGVRAEQWYRSAQRSDPPEGSLVARVRDTWALTVKELGEPPNRAPQAVSSLEAAT